MAAKITGTRIELTRGDTLIAEIQIFNADGTEYIPIEGETIRFALKSARMLSGCTAFVDVEPLITKQIPIDTLILEINPNDTKGLYFGNYVYDIEITHNDNSVDTFIPNAQFVLTPEVH